MDEVKGVFVYIFTCDDGQDYPNRFGKKWERVNAVARVMGGPENAKEQQLVKNIKAAFRAAGWKKDNDGDLCAVLIPPVFAKGGADGFWFPIFQTKTTNNGTSWIASPYELGFAGELVGGYTPFNESQSEEERVTPL